MKTFLGTAFAVLIAVVVISVEMDATAPKRSPIGSDQWYRESLVLDRTFIPELLPLVYIEEADDFVPYHQDPYVVTQGTVPYRILAVSYGEAALKIAERDGVAPAEQMTVQKWTEHAGYWMTVSGKKYLTAYRQFGLKDYLELSCGGFSIGAKLLRFDDKFTALRTAETVCAEAYPKPHWQSAK